MQDAQALVRAALVLTVDKIMIFHCLCMMITILYNFDSLQLYNSIVVIVIFHCFMQYDYHLLLFLYHIVHS